MWSIYDLNDRFDNLNFQFFSLDDQNSVGDALTAVCTNIPYYTVTATKQIFTAAVIRSVTFPCRRQNWNATCA